MAIVTVPTEPVPAEPEQALTFNKDILTYPSLVVFIQLVTYKLPASKPTSLPIGNAVNT